MGWRSILGIDLAGKLSTWKRHYKGDWRQFDHRSIWCSVTEWHGDLHTVSASTYCNDPSATGFDIRPIAWFYRSQRFASRAEAEAHLEAEIRRATKKHPQTKFFRSRECISVEDGRVAEVPITIDEFCLAGEWHLAKQLPSYKRCEACGFETEDSICPKCGELIFS